MEDRSSIEEPSTSSCQPANASGAMRRIPMKEKLAYGAAGITDAVGNTSFQTLLTPIYTLVLGLSPTLVSTILVLFRLWDAVTDSLIGWLSDNTRSRWGRRHPYIFVGAVASALILPSIWWVGAEWPAWAKIAWMIGSGLLLYTATTIWNVPYQCLLLEMTTDSSERNNISAVRAYFQKFAGLGVGWIWFLTQLPVFVDEVTGSPDTLFGARVVSSGIGVIVLICGLLPVFFVPERRYSDVQRQAKLGFFQTFTLTFQNRPFVIFGVFTLLFCLAANVNTGLSFFTKLYYVSGGDKLLAAKLVGAGATAAFVAGLVAIPVFQWLANHHGKPKALFVAVLLLLTAELSTLIFYTPSNPWLVLIVGMMISPAQTGMWVVIPAVNADVLDHDELVTGQRREGAFAAVFSWLLKISISLGVALSGPLVELVGFRVGADMAQSPEVVERMRLLNAFVPAVLYAGALVALTRFPLGPERMAAIRRELDAKHA